MPPGCRSGQMPSPDAMESGRSKIPAVGGGAKTTHEKREKRRLVSASPCGRRRDKRTGPAGGGSRGSVHEKRRRSAPAQPAVGGAGSSKRAGGTGSGRKKMLYPLNALNTQAAKQVLQPLAAKLQRSRRWLRRRRRRRIMILTRIPIQCQKKSRFSDLHHQPLADNQRS